MFSLNFLKILFFVQKDVFKQLYLNELFINRQQFLLNLKNILFTKFYND